MDLKADNMADKVCDMLDKAGLDEEGKAFVAAHVLNECNPNNTNILVFLNELDDNMHNELVSRCEDREDR